MITHAVIPVAGFGTRMLPLSKSVPKELLPLGNKPAIQYVIEEAISAGIKHIVLVTHPQKQAIENYLDINTDLDNQLREKGKSDIADKLNFLPSEVTFSSIRQGKPLGLGHAVLSAQPIIGDRPFAVLLPDVIINPFTTDYAHDNLAKLIGSFENTSRSQILVDPVADKDVSKYGIARLEGQQKITKSDTSEVFAVKGFVEKPKLEDAPSNLAVVGRYVFDNKIFDYLAKTLPSVGGEIQLTDAIDALISTQGMDVVIMTGNSFDAGDIDSYMDAFSYFVQQIKKSAT